jgi:O-antigen/teichoic acid export membrane protein
LRKQTGLLVGSTTFFITSLIIFITRFATSVLIARTLGAEGKGVYTLTLTAASLLALFLDMGLTGAITYYTASRQFKVDELFSYSLWISLLLSLAGGFFFYLLYKDFLVNSFLIGVDAANILIIILFLPINLFGSFLSGIILGLQHIFDYNLISVVRVFGNLVLQVISALRGGGVFGAVLAWVGGNVLAFLLTLWFLRKDLHFNRTKQRRIYTATFSYGIKSYIANLMSFFNYRLDSFLVNFYSGPTNVGLYTTGVSSAELLWNVPEAISSALFPKSAALDKTVGGKLTAQVCRLVLLVTVPLAMIFGLAGIFLIPFVFGQAFLPSVSPFLWLLPGIIALSLSKVIFAYLSGIGKPQYATFSSGVTLVATILLDIILIPPMGIKGAAIASSISYLLSSTLSVFLFTRETHISWSEVVLPKINDAIYLFQRGLEILAKSLANIKGLLQSTRKA